MDRRKDIIFGLGDSVSYPHTGRRIYFLFETGVCRGLLHTRQNLGWLVNDTPRHTLSLIYPTESVCTRSMLSLNVDERPVSSLWLTLVRPSSSFCTHSDALFCDKTLSPHCAQSLPWIFASNTPSNYKKTSCCALLSFHANHKWDSHVSRTPVTTELT